MTTLPTAVVAPAAGFMAAIAALLHKAGQALERDPGDARRIIAHASAMLARGRPDIPAAGEAAPPLPSGLAAWQARRVAAMMNDRLDTSLSVQEMAEAVRLSRSHFCRAFKTSFGETPHAHLLRLRVRRAEELMLRTREPLAQIAASCGLADQAHLSRLFRAVTGETPSHWRRRQRQALPAKNAQD